MAFNISINSDIFLRASLTQLIIIFTESIISSISKLLYLYKINYYERNNFYENWPIKLHLNDIQTKINFKNKLKYENFI